MSASLLALCLLGCFLQVFGQGEVFHGAPGKQAVFLRSKRANQFLLEEILQGNLERECYEELCNFEEAREVFEDTDKTISFWTRYYDGNQCDPNPCQNGGSCTDKVGGFSCSCSAPHHGALCEMEVVEAVEDQEEGGDPLSVNKSTFPEIAECPTEGPEACHQICTASYRSFTCSCTSGFKLQSDGRSCLPEVRYPCGRLPDATASMCHHDNCPWQVSLLNSSKVELCGGVVLGRHSVLTSARCLLLDSGPALQPSSFYVRTGNSMIFSVRAVYLHDRFRMEDRDDDLALLELTTSLPFGPAIIHLCLPTRDFAENILMHSGRAAEGDGELVYMQLDECRGQMDVPHQLSNKMFCMRKKRGPPEIPRPQRRHKVFSESPRGSVGKPNGTLGRLNKPNTSNRTQNQTQNTPSRIPKRAETASSGLKTPNDTSPHISGGTWPCGGPSPGSPVATVEKGTAFLTGLLMSSSASCDGQVFIKVSRYLNWIKPRVRLAEDRMTPQVSQYPENR